MEWGDLPRSSNVEGGAAPRPRRRRAKQAAGGGLVAVVVAGLALFFPEIREEFGFGKGEGDKPAGALTYADNPRAFTEHVLGATEAVWAQIFAEGAFPEAGEVYRHPTLELFDQGVTTGCGSVGAEVGPFYCPIEERIYIAVDFYRDLAETFDAPGDFGAAFVIAHEVGHHVQKVSGLLDQAYRIRLTSDSDVVNQISVRLELQADCYAGVWAARVELGWDALEPGDIEEGLRVAHQVGDDVIRGGGSEPVDASQFTHGSSVQRMRWFTRGYESGEVTACDTFEPAYEAL